MEIVLFAIALLLLLMTGAGIALLLVTRDLHLLELCALALLFGAGIVSLASFLLGWLLSGLWLKLAVTIICLAIGAAGAIRLKKKSIRINAQFPDSMMSWLLCAVVLIQNALAFWIAIRLPFGWDGIYNWELKARLAFQNGGSLPLNYFSGSMIDWSHPEYPLLLSLTEAWLYSWQGQPHQGIVKLLLPFFYLADCCLLFTAAQRFSGNKWTAWLPVLLMFFIPQVIFQDGSMPTGYADFPLAVIYLAAAIYLADYFESEKIEALRMAGALGVLLIWTKQEGVILLSCLLVIAACKALPQKKWRDLVWLALPGFTLFVFWTIFLRGVRAPVGSDYLPVTPATFQQNLLRVPEIVSLLARELVNWKHWSLLWPGVLLSLLLLRVPAWKQRTIALLLSVMLPLCLYQGFYFFIETHSRPLWMHSLGSLPRLLLQISLPAILLTGVWAGSLIEKNEFRHRTGD